MGQARTQRTRQPTTQPDVQASPRSATTQPSRQEEVAALIAAILVGSVSVPNPTLAIAQALLNLIPAFLSTTLAARVSADVARLVITDPPTPQGGLEALGEAYLANLEYRALYGIAAIKRIAKVAKGSGAGMLEERLNKAIKTETSYFEAHKNAARRRVQGATLNDVAASIHGPVLSWVHLDTTKTHRPSHVRAHGKNYRVDSPPKETDGMLPAMAPGCDCVPGPPIPGVAVMG